METVLKGKTRKAIVKLGFCGVNQGNKNLLAAKSSNNFFCQQGTLKTTCVSSMKQPSGRVIYCTGLNPIALRFINQYNKQTKVYTRKMFLLSPTGMGYKEGSIENSFMAEMWDLGKAELIAFKGKDLLSQIVACGTQACAILNENAVAQTISVENPNGAACFFKNRLFLALKPSTLAYSAVEKPTNFNDSPTEGGKISFPLGGGELIAIKVFKEKMYLFFDYGIMRLELGGNPRESKAKKIEYSGGKILKRTVCVGSEAVFFFAEDGLYRLDEREVKKLNLRTVILPYADSGSEGCAPWNGMVMIRYQVEETAYKTLAVREDGSDCFYLDDMAALSKDEGGMVLFKEKTNAIQTLNESGNLFNSYAKFTTEETDLGTAQTKILTGLRFQGKGDFSLIVYNGGRKTKRKVKMKNGAAEVLLFEKGKRFHFVIEAQAPLQIDEMTAEMKISV